ncbi:MAG: hypothetical protein VB096_01350 [Pseudoflavonifractor sp.]|nr:hypothetical protein [Pseudoflavonifractor sp.]
MNDLTPRRQALRAFLAIFLTSGLLLWLSAIFDTHLIFWIIPWIPLAEESGWTLFHTKVAPWIFSGFFCLTLGLIAAIVTWVRVSLSDLRFQITALQAELDKLKTSAPHL